MKSCTTHTVSRETRSRRPVSAGARAAWRKAVRSLPLSAGGTRQAKAAPGHARRHLAGRRQPADHRHEDAVCCGSAAAAGGARARRGALGAGAAGGGGGGRGHHRPARLQHDESRGEPGPRRRRHAARLRRGDRRRVRRGAEDQLGRPLQLQLLRLRLRQVEQHQQLQQLQQHRRMEHFQAVWLTSGRRAANERCLSGELPRDLLQSKFPALV